MDVIYKVTIEIQAGIEPTIKNYTVRINKTVVANPSDLAINTVIGAEKAIEAGITINSIKIIEVIPYADIIVVEDPAPAP